MRKLFVPACAALVLAAAAPSFAADGAAWWQPDTVFVQAGSGRHVASGGLGLTWDWGWRSQSAVGTVTGYTELGLGRWETRGRASDEGFSTVGVTPMLRLYPQGMDAGWFAEAGIGANAISPHYRNGTREFSTTFNFGDVLGVGRRFGRNNAHELVLRIEHFSNAGISHPTPGENFAQVRYAFRF